MEKRVNFAVVKEKIIKTDELLSFYEDKNTKLVKLSHAYKEAKTKYETAVAEINRLRMENDRLNFNLESIKPKFEQNELELQELKEDHARLDEKYQQTLIDSQSHYKSLKDKINSCICDKEVLSPPSKNTKSQSELRAEEKVRDFKEKYKEVQQQEIKLKKENAVLILKNKELVEGFEKERKKHAEDVQHFHLKNENLQKEINKLKVKVRDTEVQHSQPDVEKVSKLELVISSLECEKDFEVKKLEKQVRRLSVDRNEMQRLKSECEGLIKQLSPQKKDSQVQTESKVSVEHSQCVRKIDFEENNIIENEKDNDLDNGCHENDNTEGYCTDDSEIYKEFCMNRLTFDHRIVKGINLSPMSSNSEHPGSLACLSPICEIPEVSNNVPNILVTPEVSNNVPNILVTPPTPMISDKKDLIFTTFKKVSSTPDKNESLRNITETEFSKTPSILRPRRRKFIMPYQNNLLPTRRMRLNSKKSKKTRVGNDSILEALKALQACNISFTISNDTNSRNPMVLPPQKTKVIKEGDENMKTENLVEEKINCWSDNGCAKDKNALIMKDSPGCKPELVGFFDVKDESVTPNTNILQKLISGIEKLVKLKHNGSKVSQGKKRRRKNDADFPTETETEIERLFEGDRADVLARNRLLREAAMRERCLEEESDFLGDSGLVSPGTSTSFVRGTPEGLVSKLSDHPSLTSEPLERRNSDATQVPEVEVQKSVRTLKSDKVKSEYDTLLFASKSLENLLQQSKLHSNESSKTDFQELVSQVSQTSETLDNKVTVSEFIKSNRLEFVDKNQDYDSELLKLPNSHSFQESLSGPVHVDSYKKEFDLIERSFSSPESLSEIPLDPPPKLEENSLDEIIKSGSLDAEQQRDSLEQLPNFSGFEKLKDQKINHYIQLENSDSKNTIEENPVQSELYSKPLGQRISEDNLITKERRDLSPDPAETWRKVSKLITYNTKTISSHDSVICKSEECNNPTSQNLLNESWTKEVINNTILPLSTEKKLVILISEKEVSPTKLDRTLTTDISPPTRRLIEELRTPSKLNKETTATQSPSLKLLDLPESPQKIVQRIRLDSESSTKSDSIVASPSFRLKNKRKITSDSEDNNSPVKKCPPKRKTRSNRRKSSKLNKQCTVSESENEEQVQLTPTTKHNLRNRKCNQKSSEIFDDTSSTENLSLAVLTQKLNGNVCEKLTKHANETTVKEFNNRKTRRKMSKTGSSIENRQRVKLRSDDSRVKSKEFVSDSVNSSSEDSIQEQGENRLSPDNSFEHNKSNNSTSMRTRKYSLRSDHKKSANLSISCEEDNKTLVLSTSENGLQPEIESVNRGTILRTTRSRKLSDNLSKQDSPTTNAIHQDNDKSLILPKSTNSLQADVECVNRRSALRKSRCIKSSDVSSQIENRLQPDEQCRDQETLCRQTKRGKSSDRTDRKNIVSPKGSLQTDVCIEQVSTPRQLRSRKSLNTNTEAATERRNVRLRSDDKRKTEMVRHKNFENTSGQEESETSNTDHRQSSRLSPEYIFKTHNVKDALQLNQVREIKVPESKPISFEESNLLFKRTALNCFENIIPHRTENLKSDTETYRENNSCEVLSDHDYCSIPTNKETQKLPLVNAIILSVKPTNTKNMSYNINLSKVENNCRGIDLSNNIIKDSIDMEIEDQDRVKIETPLNDDLVVHNNNGLNNIPSTIFSTSKTPKVLKSEILIDEKPSENLDNSCDIGNQIRGTIRNRISSETIESENQSVKSISPGKNLTARIVHYLNPNDSKLAHYLKEAFKDKEQSFTESECESVMSCPSGSPCTPRKLKMMGHLEPKHSSNNTITKKHLSVKDLFGDSSDHDSKNEKRESASSDNNDKIIPVDQISDEEREVKTMKNETSEHYLFGELSDSEQETGADSDNSSNNSSILLESANSSFIYKKPKGTLRANILKQVKTAKNRAKVKSESYDNISKLPYIRPIDRGQEKKINIVQDIRISKEGMIIDLDNLGSSSQTIDVKPKIEPKSEIEDFSPLKMEELNLIPTCSKAVVRNLNLKSKDVSTNIEKNITSAEKIAPKSEVDDFSFIKTKKQDSANTFSKVTDTTVIKQTIEKPPRKKRKLQETNTTETDIVTKVLQDMIKSKPKPKIVQNTFKTVNSRTYQRNPAVNRSAESRQDTNVEKAQVDPSFDDYDCPKSPDVIETPDADCLPKIIPTEKPKIMAGSRVRVLFNKLLIYSREENVVDEIVAEFATQDDTYIADIILQKVAQDFRAKADNAHPPAPPLTSTQRILLGFMARLARSSHPSIYDKFMAAAEMQLFDKLKCELKMVAPVTRLYTAVCKLKKDINRMRRFCCEAFYFMGDFAMPLFFTVLTMWSEVLPMEVKRAEYPQAKVLVQLCYIKECNQPGYNLLPLRDFLNKFFGYPNERWNCDEVFQEVLIQYLRNPALRLSDFTLLLFLKNKPTKWVYQKMRENIMPLVETIPPENCNLKATLMILLGNICHNFNKYDQYDWTVISEMKEWFTSWNKDDSQPILTRSIQLVMSRLPNKPKIKAKVVPTEDNNEIQDTKKKPKKPKKLYLDLDAPQDEINQLAGRPENVPDSSCKRQKRSYRGVANNLVDFETFEKVEEKKDKVVTQELLL